jgi:uncharacterized oxidoreductase
MITGGTSGIGLALAREFLKRDNTVIVTGRDLGKLQQAKAALPKLHTIQSDVSDARAIAQLHAQVTREFPELNVIVNNAGIMKKVNMHADALDLEEVTREIEINLMGPIRMVKQFLPHLKAKDSAAIVNISSGLAFIPFAISPVYSAAKAGIHAFTQALRMQLKNTRIAVIELAPPGTETALFRGDFSEADLAGAKGMAVDELAQRAMKGFEKGTIEIRPGLANMLKIMSRIAPQFGLHMLGKNVDGMLAQSESR